MRKLDLVYKILDLQAANPEVVKKLIVDTFKHLYIVLKKTASTEENSNETKRKSLILLTNLENKELKILRQIQKSEATNSKNKDDS